MKSETKIVTGVWQILDVNTLPREGEIVFVNLKRQKTYHETTFSMGMFRSGEWARPHPPKEIEFIFRIPPLPQEGD